MKDWDVNEKPAWLDQILTMSRKRFLLSNGAYAVIGFLLYFITFG